MEQPASPANASATNQPYPNPQAHGDGSTAEYHQAQAAAATANAALSHEHTSTPNGTVANGRKRRASGQPGSRGVANLTPIQLAKKRENDRMAQRAIRERTRNNIEGLEARIRELESQQPYQELQRVEAERDRALAECEELRRRLGAGAGIVGGGGGQQQHPSLNELANLTAQQSPLPSLVQHQQTYQQSQPSAYEGQPQPLHHALSSQHSTAQDSPVSQASTAGQGYQAGEGSLRRWSPSQDLPQMRHYTSTPDDHYAQQRQIASAHLQGNGERLGLNFLLDSPHQRAGKHDSPSTQGSQPYLIDQHPIYSRLTNVGVNSCPLDALLKDFHASRRKMMREGASPAEAIGEDYPNFASMLAADSPEARSSSHAISTLLIDILSKFPDINALPEKVAVFYIMFLVMRWLVCPCQSCYERLPEWCRPTQEQLDVPHVAWCDYLPWPYMRSRLCRVDRKVKFEDFFIPYTTTLSLNWPLPPETILLTTPAAHPEDLPNVTMNPAFEAHLRSLDNWTLGSRFRATFPELVDQSVRIRDVERDRRS